MRLAVGMLLVLLASGCAAKSACEADPCDHDAVCTDVDPGGFQCACAPGFAGDGFECCSDADGDGVCKKADNCAESSNTDQADFNADGVGDACDTIVLPLAELGTTVRYFEYDGTAGTVYYFAVLDSRGTPHVAIDANDICYTAKRGFRQEGDEMVCNNCGKRFAIAELGEHVGDCNPGVVEFTATVDEVRVEPEALEAASWYFQ